MKIGIYLGDIKDTNSIGDLTFELSFIDELLNQKTEHKFIFYYYGKKKIFSEKENAKFVNLKYYKKPAISFQPFCVKTHKTPFRSLNHRMQKDNVNLAYFLVPYLHEHIEIPYFAVIRDVAHRIFPHFPEFSTNIVFEKMEKKLNRFLTAASKIITCNEVSKNDIKNLYDVISENIIVKNLPCPNWVKTAKNNTSILKKNSLSKNSYILYPAQFWTHKNHIRLILLAQVLKESNMKLKIVFTGKDRGNKDYIIQQTKKLDLEKEIIFLDFVERDELADLYRNAFALVYPSLAGPDSIVAFEALYFNCPVLISNHLGYHQQLKKSALYFNPLSEHDIVEKIKQLSDIATKDDIIANGQLVIKENSCKNYVDSFLNMVDNFYLLRQCWSLEEDYRNKE